MTGAFAEKIWTPRISNRLSEWTWPNGPVLKVVENTTASVAEKMEGEGSLPKSAFDTIEDSLLQIYNRVTLLIAQGQSIKLSVEMLQKYSRLNLEKVQKIMNKLQELYSDAYKKSKAEYTTAKHEFHHRMWMKAAYGHIEKNIKLQLRDSISRDSAIIMQFMVIHDLIPKRY